MIYRASMSLLLVSCSLFAAAAPRKPAVIQRHVDPGNTHVRFLAVVPLIGTGQKGDPIRPAYVPAPPAPGAKLDTMIGVNYFFSLTTTISPYRRQLLFDSWCGAKRRPPGGGRSP